jgi:hypothetical protein
MFCANRFTLGRAMMIGCGLAILGSGVFTGCKKEAEITRYQVPKEKAIAAAAPSAAPRESTDEESKTDDKTPGQDRMLAAIVPQGDKAWFFKLAGQDDAVGKHAEAFESLVQSVSFPESAGGEPQWKAPDDWKRLPGNQFRFATLAIPTEGGKPLELTITTLGWQTGGPTDLVLENINRWRREISLKMLKADELETNIRKVKLEDGEAILVDLHGTLKAGGMRPPFATRPGGTEN